MAPGLLEWIHALFICRLWHHCYYSIGNFGIPELNMVLLIITACMPEYTKRHWHTLPAFEILTASFLQSSYNENNRVTEQLLVNYNNPETSSGLLRKKI